VSELTHPCPDCGRRFAVVVADAHWLAEAMRRNPKLQLICSACGRRELRRLNGQKPAVQ